MKFSRDSVHRKLLKLFHFFRGVIRNIKGAWGVFLRHSVEISGPKVVENFRCTAGSPGPLSIKYGGFTTGVRQLQVCRKFTTKFTTFVRATCFVNIAHKVERSVVRPIVRATTFTTFFE